MHICQATFVLCKIGIRYGLSVLEMSKLHAEPSIDSRLIQACRLHVLRTHPRRSNQFNRHRLSLHILPNRSIEWQQCNNNCRDSKSKATRCLAQGRSPGQNHR